MKKQVRIVGILNKFQEKFPAPVAEAIRALPGIDGAVMLRAVNVTELKDADDEKMSATIYLSTRLLDMDKDIVTPTGWDLSIYQRNNKGLWSHDWSGDPIYKADWTKPDSFGLQQRIIFDSGGERAANYYRLMSKGFLKTFSAGFRTTESFYTQDEEFHTLMDSFKRDWPECKDMNPAECFRIISGKILLESSLCNIPSNPASLIIALGDGKEKVCEQVRRELKIDDITRKCVDSGEVDKKYAKGPAPVPAKKAVAEPSVSTFAHSLTHTGAIPPVVLSVAEEPAKKEVAITEVSIPVIRIVPVVREVIDPGKIAKVIANAVQDEIARRRGAI